MLEAMFACPGKLFCPCQAVHSLAMLIDLQLPASRIEVSLQQTQARLAERFLERNV